MRTKLAAMGATGLMLGSLGAVASAPPASAEDTETEYGRMMLVLDSSGSMKESAGGGQTKIQAAKSALGSVIDDLPGDAHVGLRVFGAEVFSRSDKGACEDTQQVVVPGTDNRGDLRSAVQDYEPYGETPIPAALRGAADDIGAEGKRSIVLVSDGESTCGDPCAVAKKVASRGIDLQIDVVGLSVSGKARQQLQCIADNGNGTYYDAEDAGDIAASLSRVATRAVRPFELTGTPVEGAAEPASAPEVATGRYRDTLPLNDGLWYRVERTAPGSTIHAGITFFAPGRGATAPKALVETYADPDGAYCSQGQSFSLGNLGSTSSMAWSSDPEDECNTADTVYIHVEALAGDQLAGQPVQVDVYEEPPLADRSGRDLGAAPDPPAWTTMEPGTTSEADIVPGSSISNAPVVEQGTHAFDIMPGETQVVAIPLGWGQRLQAQLDATLPAEIDGYDVPYVQIAGPLGARAATDHTGFAETPKDWSGTYPNDASGEDFRTGAWNLPTSYLNRADVATFRHAASLPGLRYVQVSYTGDGDPVEYRLTLRTFGTAGDGAPEYADVEGLTPPAADSALVVTGDRSAPGDHAESQRPAAEGSGPAEESAAEASPEDPGISFKTVAGVGGVGLGVLALLAAGVLLLRRRRA